MDSVDKLRKAFGAFERVVIDVDGEEREFDADSLIRLLEGYESCGQVPEREKCNDVGVRESYSEICGDGRFELIGKARAKLLEATNIEMCPDEMTALSDILFRCWQMGWLDQLRDSGTRWQELFGTPERTAWTFADFCDKCDEGECNGCPLDKLTDFCIGYDDLLEWLESEVRDD